MWAGERLMKSLGLDRGSIYFLDLKSTGWEYSSEKEEQEGWEGGAQLCLGNLVLLGRL